MTGDSRDYLRQYADAIHYAHALTGDMDFTDLGHALNMTCALQQHIVSLISRDLRNLGGVIEMRRRGTNTSMDTEVDSQLSDDQNSVVGSENIENGETTNNHDFCGPSNHVEDDTVPANSQMSSTCSSSTSQQAYESSSDEHELTTIDKLCECLRGSVVVSDSTDCLACKLRKEVYYETNVTTVCAACPGVPRLCSLPCFLWWHIFHIPTSRTQPTTTIRSEQTGTRIRESNDQVMVSESQVTDQSSEFRASEESVLQPCTASVRRVVGKRRRRKASRYRYVRRKVQPKNLWKNIYVPCTQMELTDGNRGLLI
uniref:Uncharacterized protein n=1 Tax=Trichobilharzia regenti TaxID=157069 RepID=A0AA85JJA2_TRIRE|nr:unnamed protein product [Trichobilharzia regenti]